MPTTPSYRTSRVSNVRRTTGKQRRQQHVLDVSVRTAEAARLRQRKLFRFTVKWLCVVGLIAGLYLGGRKAVSWLLLKNPDYNVGELTVETDGVLAPEAVLEAADVHKGSNIFLVNLTRAKSRVEAMPLVEKAQVSRQLPNRIAIQVNERKPVAWLAPTQTTQGRDAVVNSPEAHLIDTHGVILPVKNAAPQDRFLPIIRHYSGGPRADGQEAEGAEIKAALDLLHAHQDSMIAARFQIQEIDLAKQFGLQVTDRNGLQVLFDLDEMDKQLKRLDSALQVLDQGPQKPHTINLLVQKNVPVTFVTEPSIAAPAPAPEVSSAPPEAALANVKTPASPKGKTAAKADRSKSSSKASTKSHGEKHSASSTKTKRGPQPFKAD